MTVPPAPDLPSAPSPSSGRPAPTVGVWMASPAIVVSVEAPLAEAIRVMEERRVHGLPVVDETGRLVGVVSQTDLARARSTEYLWMHWPGLTVRHLMTSPAVTTLASTPLDQAARTMERLGIHRLVVIADDDDTRPIGVLSMTDLVHAIAAEAGPAAPMPAAAALTPAGPHALVPTAPPETANAG